MILLHKKYWVIYSILFSANVFAADLTLEEALRQSRTYWSVRLGSSQVDAEASSSLAKSAFLPNVNGGLFVRKDYLVNPSEDFQGTTNLGADQQLLNVSDWLTISARKADAISQACQTENDQILVSQTVISSFFNTLTNMDEDRMQAKRASRVKKAVDFLRETTKLRLSAQSDLYLAESQINQVEIERAQVSSNKISALNQLRTQLGLPPKDALSLDSAFIKKDADTSSWVEWSENTPSVLVLKAKVEAASKDLSATQWEIFPSVDLSVDYNKPVTGLPGDDDSLSILGTVNVPLFDRMSRQIRARRNKKLLTIFENLLQNKKVEVSNAIASLIVQRKADQIALEQATKQMEISEKAYKGAWTLLSLGKNDFFNVQNAQDVAINAERQVLQIQRRLDATNANLQLLLDSVTRAKSKKYNCLSLN